MRKNAVVGLATLTVLGLLLICSLHFLPTQSADCIVTTVPQGGAEFMGSGWVVCPVQSVVRILDRRTLAVQQEISLGAGYVTALAVGGAGEDLLAWGDSEGTLSVYDRTARKTLFSCEAHRGAVWRIQFDESAERMLTAGADGAVLVWDLSAGSVAWDTDVLSNGHSFPARLSGDGHLVTFADGTGRCDVWNVDRNERLDHLSIESGIHEAHFVLPSYIVYNRFDAPPEVRSISNGDVVCILGNEPAQEILLSSTQAVFVDLYGDHGYVYAIRGRSCEAVCRIEAGRISTAAWSTDGRYLATWTDGQMVVSVWDAQDGHHVFDLEGAPDRFTYEIRWSPDNEYVLGVGSYANSGVLARFRSLFGISEAEALCVKTWRIQAVAETMEPDFGEQ